MAPTTLETDLETESLRENPDLQQIRARAARVELVTASRAVHVYLLYGIEPLKDVQLLTFRNAHSKTSNTDSLSCRQILACENDPALIRRILDRSSPGLMFSPTIAFSATSSFFGGSKRFPWNSKARLASQYASTL
jgi:hypothetical protein